MSMYINVCVKNNYMYIYKKTNLNIIYDTLVFINNIESRELE
jgi:hypothetical protein